VPQTPRSLLPLLHPFVSLLLLPVRQAAGDYCWCCCCLWGHTRVLQTRHNRQHAKDADSAADEPAAMLTTDDVMHLHKA
jgi:hypothetical protein